MGTRPVQSALSEQQRGKLNLKLIFLKNMASESKPSILLQNEEESGGLSFGEDGTDFEVSWARAHRTGAEDFRGRR